MEWLLNAFWARIGWAAGEVAIAIAVLLMVGLLALLISAPRLLRQSRCKHLHYRETGSCDAICNDCGKNLGFIGRVRSNGTASCTDRCRRKFSGDVNQSKQKAMNVGQRKGSE